MSTPLYVKSVYSLLSSTCTIKGMVKKASELGYSSLALVDHGVMSGMASFKKECLNQGIKPIYGLECDLSYRERVFPIVLYAKDSTGLSSLMTLSSFVSTGGTLDISLLKNYLKGTALVFLSDQFPFNGGNVNVLEAVKELKSEVGEFYAALCDHHIAANRINSTYLKPILKECGISTLALSRTYYLSRDDVYEFEVLRCIRDHRTIDKLQGVYASGQHFLSKEEYDSLYDRDDLIRADKFALELNAEYSFKTELPDFPLKPGVAKEVYLSVLAKEGLRRRLKGANMAKYYARLEYELKTIMAMGFTNYFLIVYDFILNAKKKGIYVGPGRGSAAGSLVSYCLGITDIDPLKYGLLFERFLNPERVSLPDIDVDFPDDRRDEVVEYVRDKYGADHVARIITFGTLKARQVVRDVGRVLNYSPFEIDGLCKMIPADPNMTLTRAYQSVASFKRKVDGDAGVKKLISVAYKLEGLPRHESTHAAGIVMSKRPISEVVPIIALDSVLNSTQISMEYLEEMGLIKMDFLALKNLSIIDEVAKAEGIDMRNIPLDDQGALQLIRDVDTLGIFQLESSGMMNLLRKLKVREFRDIGVVIALFRPGPMENIPVYLKNMSDPAGIDYLHEDLKPILAETYGVIVYQEQIMAIARVLAGFSYGKADILRRAMSKKKEDVLKGMSKEFIDGCLARGYEKEVAIRVYDLILRFANYGFNKSHSIAYGRIAYEMAYLKANYPLSFYRALLNGSSSSSERSFEYISECERRGNRVVCPNINLSELSYVIADNRLIMPLGVVKNVGGVMASRILDERKNNGPFRDYLDCVCRLNRVGVDRAALSSLISAGAFDGFELARYTMYINLSSALMYAGIHKNDLSLEGFDDGPLFRDGHDDPLLMAENEKEALGFYLTYNPLKRLRESLKRDVKPFVMMKDIGLYYRGVGLVDRIKEHRTKRGDMMAFISLKDDTDSLSLVVMPDVYARFREVLNNSSYLFFDGLLEKEGSVMVKKLEVVSC